jgi:hypothetical protein
MYSVLLALIAPAIVIATGAYMVNLPNGAAESAENFATVAMLSAYGVVAPLMHLVGIGFGIAGLRSPNAGKVASCVGILLNVALIGIGLIFGWAALSGLGAYT